MKESLMSRSLLPPVSTTAVLVLASGLVACSVGPDFTPPAAPKAESYLAPGETSGKETVQGRIVGD